MITFHSSRSRYESFATCQRKGFLNYCYQGRGLQKKARNIFLSTGIWTHRGIEMIAKWVQKNNKIPGEDVLGFFVEQVKKGYFEYVFPQSQLKGGYVEGFELAEETNDEWQGGRREFTDLEKQRIQQYLFNEQSALVEAFMRVFVARVLPKWLARFRIVTVENDMGFPFANGAYHPGGELAAMLPYEVVQSATIDIVMQERDTKDIYIVSLKTNNSNYDRRHEKANLHDTQGLSEIWAFEEFLRARGTPKQVMGVMMLFFIKGKREETEDGSGVWVTKSPLIKGYRKLGVTDVEYAHSMYFPNPSNKSGWGRLGGGWEEFDVWDSEEVGGIKGWVNMLLSGQIQPECGDILEPVLSPEKKKRSVLIEPRPYYRQPRDIESWLRQTQAEERRIAEKLIAGARMQDQDEALDEFFPQNRRACHYPGDCQFVNVCFGTEEERSFPLRGEFELRTAHHKAELVQIEGGA